MLGRAGGQGDCSAGSGQGVMGNESEAGHGPECPAMELGLYAMAMGSHGGVYTGERPKV